ncbi:aldo/keto reductase [Sphingobacterium thalpophilum]|uniref:Putative aldo-keto reductase n=1 Tax=Sphingobacterium thalpophilum TaxID=259 RepID=A0A4V6KQM7_9SPHI|nr:aldo/keto reductase [Sphingobacterium thalpophilum]VTR34238.1 putative aldo-keto reductase [Sphingobacterium thalpophilum]
MKKQQIKHTDLQVAPINFGGNVFGWTLDEKQSFDILDKFVGAGFNFIDTADTYSWWVNGRGGQSEEIIGKWLKSRGRRQDLVIATKVGSETKEHGFDISRKHILQSADESLHRLGVDHIDLYYTHFDDKVTPVEETLSAYDELIRAGKVRYIAASNVSPQRLIESFSLAEEHGLPRYVALQPHYNLVERSGFENDYAPLVEKYDLSVFPYWSLAAGFLTGKYRSVDDFEKTTRGAGIKKYFDEKGKAVLKALDTVAEKYDAKQATVALAWLLANPLVTAPIVSATSESQLQTLIAAPDLQLDQEDIGLLDQASQE